MTSGAFRIGTRRSRLASWQAEWVAAALRAAHPGLAVEVIGIETLGDRDKSTALAGLGRTGVFTKEIEDALQGGRCDLAVHSFKDLATRLPAGLIVGAVPERADPRDALVSRRAVRFDELPRGALVGTSSLRRRALLLLRRPDLRVTELRGNVPTRLRAAGIDLADGRVPAGPPLDATLMALAGLARLGFHDHASEILDPAFFPPAPAQGALALQIRATDERAASLIAPLDHGPTRRAVAAERAFLATLEGGCHVPVGALAEVRGDDVRLAGMVVAPDGSRAVEGELTGRDAETVGRMLASDLKRRGAGELLASLAAVSSECGS
jgi:hydroxymethylbilane synthase